MTSSHTVLPEDIIKNWNTIPLQGNDWQDLDFAKLITDTFNLPSNDDYVYIAERYSMTLKEVQVALNSSPLKYQYSFGHGAIPIPDTDIREYTRIFASSTDTTNSLKSFLGNSKKGSPRRFVAEYLASKRANTSDLKITRLKTHPNPYLDIWIWSCLKTGFVGPLPTADYANQQAAKQTHPILPILYHHFGCVCPTWEAICIIKALAARNSTVEGVLEMASGNGYWTFMLRRAGIKVDAIDNMESTWRYTWIDDTRKADGVSWLKKHDGARKQVLLMVYMVVRGAFTKDVLSNYKGDTIVIAGTQNANRYTSFSDMGVEEYFAKAMPGWRMSIRIALPSFAGKDEAMFVYERVSEQRSVE